MSEPTNDNESVDPTSVPVTAENLAELGLAAPQRDYTLERSRRVLPFVKFFMAGIGSHPIDTSAAEKETAAYDEFYSTVFMPGAMSNGLRLKDMSYTFSLMKTAIEMLKSQYILSGEGTAERLVPIAQELFTALAEQETLMLDIDENEPKDIGAQRAALYTKLVQEVLLPLIEKHSIQHAEVDQLFATLLALVFQLEHRSNRTLGSAFNLAESKFWGVEDVDDITIQAVHEKCLEKEPETE